MDGFPAGRARGLQALESLCRKPHPAKPGSVFPRLQPKASRSLPSWTETQVSVTPSYLASESLRVPKAGRSPLGKRPRRAARSRVTRSRHKRPPPAVYASLAGDPSIYSVSPLSWLRSALGGYCILRSIALSSFLATVSQPQKLLVLWSGKQKQVDLHFECGREFNKNDDTGGTFYRSIGIGSAMAGGRMPL